MVKTTTSQNKKAPKKPDTYSYKGWLNSDKLLKRAFAVWGYYFVAHIIISLVSLAVIAAIILLIFGVIAFFGAMAFMAL
mgnify:FL=1